MNQGSSGEGQGGPSPVTSSIARVAGISRSRGDPCPTCICACNAPKPRCRSVRAKSRSTRPRLGRRPRSARRPRTSRRKMLQCRSAPRSLGAAIASRRRSEAGPRAEKPIGERKRGMGDNNPPEAMTKEQQTKPKDAEPVERPRGERGPFAARQLEPWAATGRLDRCRSPASPPSSISRCTSMLRTVSRRALCRRCQGRSRLARRAGERARCRASNEPRVRQRLPALPPRRRGVQTIEPFFEMARQQGTTVERALHNYTQMEQKLRAGPDRRAWTIIVHNLICAPNGSKITLRDIAWHILNQTPEQHATGAATRTRHRRRASRSGSCTRSSTRLPRPCSRCNMSGIQRDAVRDCRSVRRRAPPVR